jgi:heavy metal sensor kinase
LPRIKKSHFATLETTSGVWRTGIMGSERITMMVGVNLAGYYQDAKRYQRAFLGIIPVALLLLAAGGWVIAQRALRPVSLITRTAESITARALDQRVPAVDADRELSRLVEVINGMLDRLEKSFGQAVRFSADAAHELQTPLTILQGELDEAVRNAPVGSDEQRRASSLLEEVQRLKAIVQKLLVLSRADAGRLSLRLEAVDLSTMIGSAAEDATALAPQLRIEKEIAPGVIVKADSDLLGQVVSNLTSNAVKYNQENGVIRFHLSVRDNRAFFTIANTGSVIPAADRERIFDRFYRVDRSRSKSISGSGLGLSLAREIAHAHRGDLRLDPVSGNMVSFILSLPCSSS